LCPGNEKPQTADTARYRDSIIKNHLIVLLYWPVAAGIIPAFLVKHPKTVYPFCPLPYRPPASRTNELRQKEPFQPKPHLQDLDEKRHAPLIRLIVAPSENHHSETAIRRIGRPFRIAANFLRKIVEKLHLAAKRTPNNDKFER
jgi:hypothetical protein